jgi:hypothetical protein
MRRKILKGSVAVVSRVKPNAVIIHHVTQQHKQHFDGKMHYGPIGARIDLKLLVILATKDKAENLVASVWAGDFVDAVLEEMGREIDSGSKDAFQFPPDFRTAQICTSSVENLEPKVCHYDAKDLRALRLGPLEEGDRDMIGTLLPVVVGTSMFFFGIWYTFIYGIGCPCSTGGEGSLPTNSRRTQDMKRNLKLMQQAKKGAVREHEVDTPSERSPNEPVLPPTRDSDDDGDEALAIRRKSWG